MQSKTRRGGVRRAVVLALLVAVGAAAGAYLVWRAFSQQDDDKTESEASLAEHGVLAESLRPQWHEWDDPSRDGWDTEVFANKAQQVLTNVHYWLNGTKKSKRMLSTLTTDSFTCESLRPDNVKEVYRDPVFRVVRGASRMDRDVLRRRGPHAGTQGLAEALDRLVASWPQGSPLYVKFKIYRIRREKDFVVTRQYLFIAGKAKGGAVEQNADWIIRWRSVKGNEPPRMDWIGVAAFEEVRAPGPLFVDCTKSVLGENACYERQFLHGMNHWFRRMQDRRYFFLFGNPGLAIADVNGDGLDDLYVCQEEGLPNRLFIQQPDGTARDVSEAWGVDWLHSSRGALLVDFDNDGDADLAVGTVGGVLLASNEGNRFQLQAILPTDDDVMSLSAADYDNDGDLDLHVCAYFANTELAGKARGNLIGGVADIGPQGEFGGGKNALFRNEGGWKFTDVSNLLGNPEHNRRYSFAAAWEDFDNDGDQDLYVANDYGPNNLFRNDGGRFVDVSESLGGADSAFGMGVTWGDYNLDGWMDVHISNMFSSAGGRITYQPKFLAHAPRLRRLYQRWARGNTLLRNNGKGGFEDVSEFAGITVGRWAWSSNFVDINGDGREDLVVANGFITGDDSSDL